MNLKAFFQEGTLESMMRLIFFLVGITTCLTIIAAVFYSLWAHNHGGTYDLPANIRDVVRDVFVAAGAGKLAQRIWGEPNQNTEPPIT